MGLIRGFSLFFLLSVVFVSLTFANISLTLSLSNSEDYFLDWNKLFIFSLGLSVLLSAAAFFIIESKTALPIVLGSVTIISALPSLLIKATFSYFENILKPISGTFSGSYSAFGIFFLAGILLIAIGIGLKFFNLGYSLSRLLEKGKKDKSIKKS